MSRRRYFEEQRSGNGAIYHCVKTEIEPGDKIRLFNLGDYHKAMAQGFVIPVASVV